MFSLTHTWLWFLAGLILLGLFNIRCRGSLSIIFLRLFRCLHLWRYRPLLLILSLFRCCLLFRCFLLLGLWSTFARRTLLSPTHLIILLILLIWPAQAYLARVSSPSSTSSTFPSSQSVCFFFFLFTEVPKYKIEETTPKAIPYTIKKRMPVHKSSAIN